jgi:hypothetical protein
MDILTQYGFNLIRRTERTGWIVLIVLFGIMAIFSSAFAGLNPNPPVTPVKLIFIHHSTGGNWLADSNGQLGIALRNNNYFVSDTNYGWVGGGTDIGDRTDIGNWWEWFNSPNRDSILADLYAESNQNDSYSRLNSDPGGKNEIVLFKSCYPNSALKGNPNDPATVGANPLRDQSSGSQYHTVGNAKGIYTDMLAYFATRQDKLFIVITAPPLNDDTYAANARAFNNWLVHDWLASYPHRNVAVFDFYNVLTSNGGNANTNDIGRSSGNHHRYNSTTETIEHLIELNQNTLAYPTEDDHPSSAGGRKASGEFTNVLNIAYHCWKGDGGCLGACLPVIKANGQDGITVAAGTTVSLTVALSPENQAGRAADWWIAADTPWGWYFLTATGWNSLFLPVMQYPLFELSPVAMYSGAFPVGDYSFYFAVDTVPDAILNEPIFYDRVQVKVIQ